MCRSMVDIQSAAAEIRRGIKKKIDRKKSHGKNIMSASATQGGHKKMNVTTPLPVFDWQVMNLEYLIQICALNTL